MIEVASHPENLKDWKSGEQQYYLEVYGETRPIVDKAYAEVQPAGAGDGKPQTSQPAPIYEYWWTIGHAGDPQQWKDLWDKLHDPAARIYLYFPLDSGWRMKEVVATLKYLTPMQQQHQLWNKAAEGFKNVVAPLMGDAGSLASLVPNPAFAGAATLLSTIAKLQINSVPPDSDLAWSVEKVTYGSDQGVMQGVVWTLPKKVFEVLGGRLTGSIAVSFIPSQRQQPGTVMVEKDATYAEASIRAHAVVYGPDKEIWAPAKNDFVRLLLAPRAS